MSAQDTIGAQSGTIAAVYLALVLFGIAYNIAIAYADKRGWMQGYTSIAVAAGVLVTLAGVALVSWQAALLVLGAFVASGTPMILGSIYRHVKTREAEIAYLKREALE